ncbi:hypothetical protein VFPBJ_02591 [Purpureocillium lilacinum]|uniref:Uncharacterized protein n=1 Tax=Purpureocillium lilacinum TaxID=33203 RepID=A0A179H111_PURLI|nr:hypothetical protein VFPBJ_02591 [Purpureocillium lilacinum]
MWLENQSGHPTPSSLSQDELEQVYCGSAPGPGLPRHNLNDAIGQSVATQTADPASANPRLIPGTNPPILVYPHSTSYISGAYHNRFREVVSMFRENAERHQELAPFVQHIDYTLRMCGTSYEAAHPSIIVFCRKQEFKCLLALLTSRELGMQYLRRKPGKTADFLAWLKRPLTNTTIAPLFNLYFWRAVRPRTLLGRAHGSTTFNPSSGSWWVPDIPYTYTLCGAVLRPFDNVKSSTFGCAILIDTELYGLTTRHNLRPIQDVWTARDAAAGPSSIKEDASPATPNSPTSDASVVVNDGCDFFINDIEYEDLPCGVDEEETASPAAMPGPFPIETLPDSRDDGLNEVSATLLPPQEELGPPGEHDFDWALFRIEPAGIEHRSPRLVNHTRVPGRSVMTHYAKACPTVDTPVLLVTSDKKPKHGVLRPGTSIVGGINGNEISPVWTIGLADGQGLEAGDSGSIVVDTRDDLIYGLVIGANPIDEIYISPFVEIMHQVQYYFPDSAISLPQPEPSSIAELHRPKELGCPSESNERLPIVRPPPSKRLPVLS